MVQRCYTPVILTKIWSSAKKKYPFVEIIDANSLACCIPSLLFIRTLFALMFNIHDCFLTASLNLDAKGKQGWVLADGQIVIKHSRTGCDRMQIHNLSTDCSSVLRWRIYCFICSFLHFLSQQLSFIISPLYSASCGGDIGGPKGIILSPGYPELYSNSLNCTWTVEVSHGKGASFLLSFLHSLTKATFCQTGSSNHSP